MPESVTTPVAGERPAVTPPEPAGRPEPAPAPAAAARWPSRRARVLVALAVGLAALALKWWVVRTGRWLESDFDQAWAAARYLLNGQDPYELIGPKHPFAGVWPFFYPLTTGIVAMPFAALPLAAARLAAAFLWSALFAYGLTRDGWERLPVVLSGSWLFAV